MKEKWKNNFKKQTQSGISLIVLVITIIIILILAAAIIITLNNNNPVMEANKARYDSDVANMQAIFTNSVAKVMAHNRAVVKITSGQINTVTKGVKEAEGQVTYKVDNAMNKGNEFGTIVFGKAENTDTTFYTGKLLPIYAAGETKWFVDEEGNISLEVGGNIYGNGEVVIGNNGINAASVAQDVTKYYGEYITNYSTGNDDIDSKIFWQIFYSDSNNIYLIADWYIPSEICPPSANNNITVNRNNYWLSMDTVVRDYESTDDITDERVKALNKSYFEYINGQRVQVGNTSALAYMLDTSENVWGSFAGPKADYAIAGPTIEMLLKSYSQKYKSQGIDYSAKAVSNNGYNISNGTSWAVSHTGMLNTDDKQYTLKNVDVPVGMWLASPSGGYHYNIMAAFSDGSISDSDYGYDCKKLGFRPLVCLNSSVTLKENEDGFEIVD